MLLMNTRKNLTGVPNSEEWFKRGCHHPHSRYHLLMSSMVIDLAQCSQWIIVPRILRPSSNSLLQRGWGHLVILRINLSLGIFFHQPSSDCMVHAPFAATFIPIQRLCLFITDWHAFRYKVRYVLYPCNDFFKRFFGV